MNLSARPLQPEDVIELHGKFNNDQVMTDRLNNHGHSVIIEDVHRIDYFIILFDDDMTIGIYPTD